LKIGITLSGGAAKGIAHIGVIKALQENGIHPEIVSGTSAGAIVGSLYAANKSPEEMMQFVNSSSLFKIVKSGFSLLHGPMKLTFLKDQLQDYIPSVSFAELEKPLFIAATNLLTGSADVFSEGPLFDAIVASCSIPWLFAPVIINDIPYVDGGVRDNMPAKCIRSKVDFLIGVNVKPKVKATKEELNSKINISLRVFDLTVWNNIKPNVRILDHYIAPEKLAKFNQFSLKQTQEIYKVGYDATIASMPELLKKIDQMQKIKSN
jgi:NTE family protein